MSRPAHDYEALLRRALAELRELKPQVEAARLTRSEPIAIVGIGCRFPGGANPAAFWRSLRDGVDGISEVPAARWDADEYFDADRHAPGKICTRRAGFVDDLFGFDARFFDILPREAERMDPQQRLLLEVAYEALEHANIRVDRLYGSRTGVFVGISTVDCALLQLSGEPEDIDPYVGTGSALSVASGRLSYALGLTGPSLAIDTACSSSLVATHLACSSLRSRECDLALVGGVNALLSPAPSINFSQAGMLAPDGRCKTFDARADGYVRGEGCGVLVLKRLSDARADGDAILAVIRGSAVNQDGPSGGLTVPNGPAQESVIRQALAMADIAPEHVAYVEAHGTGTSLGDPIEVNALAAALCKERTPDRPLLVGSVKTNIGHCEAAAGVAGIIKVVLSLAHREIPPHLNFEQPNPHVDWDAMPVEVVTRRRPWPAGRTAVAGISSFGFSGTNAHVVLEEPPQPESAVERPADSPPYLLPLSAKTPGALADLAARFDDYLAACPQLSLSAICRSAALGRRHFEHRLAVAGGSREELRQQLAAIRSQDGAPAPRACCGTGVDRSLAVLAERYVAGEDVDWQQVHRDGPGPAVRIPTYPFQRRQYPIAWPRTRSAPPATAAAPTDFSSLPETTMAEVTPRTTVSGAASPPRLAGLVDKLREMSQSLTGIDVAEIDPERNVFELGFDSITLMRLRQGITKVYGLQIAMSELSKLESLSMIAGFLDANLPAEPVAAPSLPAASAPSPALAAAQPAAVSAFTNAAPVANSELGAIFAKQLELMAKQIELLSRSGASEGIAAAASRAPAPAPAQAKVEPPQRTASKAAAPVALPSFKKLGETPKARVSDQQQQEIQALIDDYGIKTRRSKEMTQEYRSVFANIRNVAGFRPEWKELIYQIIVDHAAGSRFTDIDGRDYLDITMGFGVYLFGHRPDFIESAVSRSLERGAPIGPMCADAGEVARRIHELTGVDRVAFFNTGSEAVMSAIRLARTVTKRPKVVMFAGSYHGHTDNLLATGHGTETLPMIPGTPESMVQETCVLPYGEDESLEFIEAHGHELAAILVEPVQSRRPEYQPAEFLKKLREVTARAGIALIFDEVILGFRVHPGGAQAYFGVQADMVTYGKTIGGGMPIGIVAGKSKFLDAIDGGMWRYGDDSTPPAENTFIAGTFNHHPLAMAAALAVLKRFEIEGPALHEQLNRRTAELAKRLNDVFDREGVPIKVVHFGSLFRFKMSGQWELFCYYMLTRGVYIWEGRNCFLSTAHSDADLDFLVRAAAESVADMRAAGAASVPSAAGRVEPSKASHQFPLTTAQHRMYAMCQSPGAELAYHVPIAMVLEGLLNEARVREAVHQLGRRHEALRTSFKLEGDGLVQVVHPEVNLALEHVSVDPGDNDAIDDAIARFIRPFDLGQAPLVRIGLGGLADGRHLLIFDAQHIIFDGMSVTVFVEDFLRIYSGEALPPPASSYHSYVEREQVYLLSADCARDEAYWLGQLGGERRLRSLPLDRPRPARQSFAGLKIYRRIDSALTRELKSLARRRGTTLNIVLLAAHFTLLHKLTGADDIIVGCPTDGRLDEDLRSVVGMFIHTFALRARLSASTTVAQLFDELKQRTLEGQDHARYPYEVLVEKLGGKRDMNRNPLFDTVFVYENLETATIAAGDLTLTGHDVRKRGSVVDLAWDIAEADSALNMSLEFDTDIFEQGTVEGFIDRYVSILRTFAQAPADMALHAIESVTPAEHQLLRAFNDTKQEVARTTVAQLFEAQAARDSSAAALVCDGTTLSYGELNERANRLAHHLIASFGAGRGLNEQLVGIALPRSIDMVVAVLATLKSGGAYLPLDPMYPKARLAAMIADAKPVVVLTANAVVASGLVDRGGEDGSRSDDVVVLDAPATLDALTHEPIANPSEAVRSLRPDSPAYVIYTSGSTGTPKGVVLEHHALTNYVTWAAQTYTQGRPLAFPLFTTLAFDLTVTSLFVPLTTGGRIVVYADDPAVPEVLRVFGEGVVDVVKLTPSHLSMIAHLDLRATSIRTLIVGGEDLKTELCRRIDERFDGQVAIFNEYGPTEAAVGCMIHRFDPERDHQTSVPIGVPVANARIYVLDGLQALAPIGAVGELYVAGDGLARGYLGRPELTAERFVPDPFSSEPAARMYRTGDLARRRADGIVEYHGRTDHQVKIRGFRVELGDVEAALVSLDTIAEAAVIAHPDASGSLQLVAYIVTSGGVQGVDTAPLRRQLELRLPGYMVPAVFIVLDRLPLSSNGKLDRGALPSPDQGMAGTGVVYEAPRDDVEKALAEVWQGVLGREQVSIHDNFFDLGGDSIKALQVVMRLQQRGYTLAPADLIDRAEFPDVAAQIRATTSRVSQAPVTGAVPLTPVQSWFAGGSAIDQHHFNQAVLLRAEPRLKDAAVRAVLEKIQDHHDALRMRFRRRDGQLVQENADVGGAVTLDVVDLRDQPQQAERAMEEHVGRLQASFDLERGPLMKAAIYRLPDADRLLLVAHHLVVDGVSWRVLLEDLSSGYDRALAGRAIVFPAKTDSYQTWARHLQQLAETGAFAAERPYWESMAAGTSPAIPGNHEAEDLQGDSESLRVVLTGETAETLAAVRGAGATVQTVLLTALARALRQVADWKQSRVTIEHHGRGAPKSDLDVSRTVGWFTALYPLTLTLPDGDDPQAHLDYTRDALQRVPNHGLGYGVLRYLTPETPLTPAAEPRIVFNYLGEFDGMAQSGFSLDRLDPRSSMSPRRPRTCELELEALLLGEGLEISLTFGGKRHDRQTMTALLSAIEAGTRALLAHGRSGAYAGSANDDLSREALDGRQLETIAAIAGCAVQDVADVYPLSPLQEGMLLHGLIDDDTSTFFIQFCFTIDGALDVELFRQSWSGLLQRHDALRARFVHQGVDRPLQIVLRERELPFHFEDLRSIPPDEQAERLARFRQLDRARGFDLTHDVLMRLAVFQDSERRFVAVLSVHHIVIDGWCLAPLFAEMATTYRALSRGSQPALPDPTRYASFIRWLESHDREASRTFWETYLRGFARPTGLPRLADRERDEAPERHRLVGELPAEDTAQLNRVVAERRVTLSSMLRAAWSLLLAKYNASDDVVFGVVVSGRPPDLPGVEHMIGMFINTVPLRIRIEPDLGVAAFARKLQDDWRQLEGHHYASLADVQSLSALGGDLLDHTLVVQNYPMADGLRQIERELDGLFTIPDVDIVEQANYPLMIDATPGERLRIEFSYDPQVHDDRLMNAVTTQLLDILRTIAAAPDTTVADMRDRLMTTDERAEREAFAQSVRTVSQEF
jgi:amino acid adenylation domain-containing protein/non-ribosomal peptide synthase protein (TIGR01720 family)